MPVTVESHRLILWNAGGRRADGALVDKRRRPLLRRTGPYRMHSCTH
jgi:hypothetical protein